MRIRTIKPEFWQSESMASVSRDARLVAIALLNYADDEGIFLANERVFRGALFPFDGDIDIIAAFRDLSEIGFVAFAEHSKNVPGTFQEDSKNVPGGLQEGSKKILGKILNFKVHQRIDKPQKSRFNAENAVFGKFQEPSKNVPGTFQEDSKNVPRVFQESSKTEVEVEMEVDLEKEKEKLSLPPRAREVKQAAPGWAQETAQERRRERYSARRHTWIEKEGAIDFRNPPGLLQWISYCKDVHPSWQESCVRKAHATLSLRNWVQGGRKIESWWQVADAWAESADHTEHFEAFVNGSMGIDASALSASAKGITDGEVFS